MALEVTIGEVEAALGRSVAEAERSFCDHARMAAAAAFTDAAGVNFGSGTLRRLLVVHRGQITIGQPGVSDVTRVTTRSGLEVAFAWDRDLPQEVSVATHERKVWVMFNYSYEASQLVRARVAEMVARVLALPKEARQGFSQITETRGPFTVSGTVSSWASGGQTLLSPEDMRLARSLRHRGRAYLIEMGWSG